MPANHHPLKLLVPHQNACDKLADYGEYRHHPLLEDRHESMNTHE